MNALRSIASVLTVGALAALFGVNCTTTQAPVNGGDDAQINESRDPQVYAPPSPSPGGLSFPCTGFATGVWCGGNRGFPGSPYSLYYCNNGAGTFLYDCPGLCVAGPPGVEDHC